MTGTHHLYTGENTSTFAEEVDALMSENVRQLRQLPTQADLKAVSNKADRGVTVAVAAGILLGIVAILISLFTAYQQGKTAAATVINSSSIQALERARDELRASGVPEQDLPEILPPEPGAPVDIDALVNATTATILAKIRNDPAFRGAAGLPGDPGAPCDPAVNPLCTGPKGDKGDQGISGNQGDDGPMGPPPAAYTMTTPTGPQTCTRDEGSPNNAPTYTCAPPPEGS